MWLPLLLLFLALAAGAGAMAAALGNNTTTPEYYYPQCNFLGIWNGRKCECEPGWLPPDCAKLNLKPLPETPASYFQGVHDERYPTFGGSAYKSDTRSCGGDVKYYWIGQTQANHAGMSCWAYNSAGSIWVSTSNQATGPYQFLSWVGFGNNTLNFAPNQVPWLGNFRFAVEAKLLPGARNLTKPVFALVMYAKTQKVRKTNKFYPVSFAEPNNAQCFGNLGLDDRVNRFYRNEAVQVTAVGYYILPDTDSECEREVEIRKILDQREFTPNVNGYLGRDEYVNTAMTWKMLLSSLPFMPQSDQKPVNPAPVYNSYSLGLLQYNGNDTAWPEYTGMRKGMYYRPLFFRWNNPRKRFIYREKLGVMAIRADKFIWEEDSPKYFVNQFVGPGYYEDPWVFETKQGLHIYTHEIYACRRMRDVLPSCGGSLHLARPDFDSLMFDNRWIDRTFVFMDDTPNLKARTMVKQRPVVFYDDGKPSVLFTGNIWKGNYARGRWNSKQGASRCFAHEVLSS